MEGGSWGGSGRGVLKDLGGLGICLVLKSNLSSNLVDFELSGDRTRIPSPETVWTATQGRLIAGIE